MIKQILKQIGRKLGVELRPYTPSSSELARMYQLLTYYNINLVLDVGANIGQYGQLLRSIGYRGRIVSFEPLSDAYSQLKVLSSKDSSWEVAPRTAIGHENSEITINIAANSYSSSVLNMMDSHLQAAPESKYIASEIVKVSRLDNIVKKYIKDDTNSIFLKIDVQGFEKQVLEGATGILPLVKALQIELSLIPLYKEEILYQEMLHYLSSLGYELYAVIPGFTDLETGRLLQMDGIFLKS